jgi:hypothetical protein
MAPDGSKPEHSEELRRPLRNVQICPITRNPTQEWAYSSQLQAASRVDFRRTVLDRDVVRKALPTHQLTTSNCEHQTHTCSHCSMTTLGRQARCHPSLQSNIARSRTGFYISTCLRVIDNTSRWEPHGDPSMHRPVV